MPEKNSIGFKVKQMRETQDMEIKQLAEDSGVSLPIVKAIEKGDVIPSLTPLTKISRALGVRLGTFLDDTPEEDPIIVRGGKSDHTVYFSGRENVTNSSDLEFHALAAGKVDRHMEPFIIDVESKEENYELSSHEGEEFIYVLNGDIELEYGKETSILNKGDSAYYDGIVPHHLHSYHKEKSQILAVLYTPKD
ncbi:MAG: XRE family transcriptional regulator [Methanobacteriaceae archaeon]|uniref:helix-turn-helix domain-containing protein n=1 Tax=Methanobrevibacter TaxID=2172 RepID=UPI002A16BDB7|nr:XRE family transcriptional regulator [Methanobacteriaceae archaeon]MDD3408632.1 XRE family transcriptional regulator [Methanobacteriaceae archaeon]MDD4594220.1 XRE family transcriptional regulator [Methanobacteriaceae archaeon]